MYVIISLSLSVVGITTRFLYMSIEHFLLNINVTFYTPDQSQKNYKYVVHVKVLL